MDGSHGAHEQDIQQNRSKLAIWKVLSNTRGWQKKQRSWLTLNILSYMFFLPFLETFWACWILYIYLKLLLLVFWKSCQNYVFFHFGLWFKVSQTATGRVNWSFGGWKRCAGGQVKKRVVEAYTNGKAPNFHQSDVSFSTIFSRTLNEPNAGIHRFERSCHLPDVSWLEITHKSLFRVGWWDLRSRPAMIGLSKVGPIHESCYWNLALSGTFVSPRGWFAIRNKVGVWCWACAHEPKPLGPWIVLGQAGTLEKGRDLMAELTTMDGVLYYKWVREFGLVKNYTSPSLILF